jgi:uncharacterized repeat protein (TIGR01451 family)
MMLVTPTVWLQIAVSSAQAGTSVGAADVAVTVTAAEPLVRVGQQLAFSLTLTNDGAVHAFDIIVAIPLPTTLTVVASSASVGQYDGDGAAWSIDSLAIGEVATLGVIATARLPAQVTGTAALVSSSPHDGNDLNNVDSVPVVVTVDDDAPVLANESADLEISTIVANDVVERGELVTQVVTLTNLGPGDSSTVEVAYPGGYGSDIVGAVASPGTSFKSRVWTVGSVPAGQSVTLEVTERANRAGIALVTAQIIQTGTPDANIDNNISRAVLRVSSADVLVLTRTDAAHLTVGADVTMTIVATNLGPHVAQGASVIGLLPPGLSLVDTTTTTGGFDPRTGVWQIGDLAPGDIQTLTIRAIAGWPGDIDVLAVITTTGPTDPNPGNNSAEAMITVVASDHQAAASGPGSWRNGADLGWWLTGSGALGLFLVLAGAALIVARRRDPVSEL